MNIDELTGLPLLDYVHKITKMMQEEELAILERRKIWDIDFEQYLELRRKIMTQLKLVKQGDYDSINLENLETLKQDLNRLKFKLSYTTRTDALRYKNLHDNFETFESLINKKQDELIDSQRLDNEIITLKLEKISEIYKQRQILNDLIISFIEHNKTIELSKLEIKKLFINDIDIKIILKSGNLLKNSNSDDDIYMFRCDILKVTCNELKKNISLKLSECEDLKKQIKGNKQNWNKLSGKLLVLLEEIDNLS